MDNKLIEQYGEDILCYRLRTARQKKRMQYEDFHKYLIRLSKEEKGLMKLKRELGWETLKPPVQKDGNGFSFCGKMWQEVNRPISLQEF